MGKLPRYLYTWYEVFFGVIKSGIHPLRKTQWANVQFSRAAKASARWGKPAQAEQVSKDSFVREEFQWREQTAHSKWRPYSRSTFITPTLPRFVRASWKMKFGDFKLRLDLYDFWKFDHWAACLGWGRSGDKLGNAGKLRKLCLLISRINK